MTTEATLAPPSRALQFWSFALPVLKCAVCPACLSLFGGLFAGARMGLLGSESFHGWEKWFGYLQMQVIALTFWRSDARNHPTGGEGHHSWSWPACHCPAGGCLAYSHRFNQATFAF